LGRQVIEIEIGIAIEIEIETAGHWDSRNSKAASRLGRRWYSSQGEPAAYGIDPDFDSDFDFDKTKSNSGLKDRLKNLL
jgi:hypothetical protein